LVLVIFHSRSWFTNVLVWECFKISPKPQIMDINIISPTLRNQISKSLCIFCCLSFCLSKFKFLNLFSRIQMATVLGFATDSVKFSLFMYCPVLVLMSSNAASTAYILHGKSFKTLAFFIGSGAFYDVFPISYLITWTWRQVNGLLIAVTWWGVALPCNIATHSTHVVTSIQRNWF
jgi:hypothetical protein